MSCRRWDERLQTQTSASSVRAVEMFARGDTKLRGPEVQFVCTQTFSSKSTSSFATTAGGPSVCNAIRFEEITCELAPSGRLREISRTRATWFYRHRRWIHLWPIVFIPTSLSLRPMRNRDATSLPMGNRHPPARLKHWLRWGAIESGFSDPAGLKKLGRSLKFESEPRNRSCRRLWPAILFELQTSLFELPRVPNIENAPQV